MLPIPVPVAASGWKTLLENLAWPNGRRCAGQGVCCPSDPGILINMSFKWKGGI